MSDKKQSVSIQRVGPRALLSLEEETWRRTEEAKATPITRDRDFEEQREG
jgi:hypothetical protein